MNAIFVPSGVADAELCHPVDPADFETVTVTIDGRPIADCWTPLKVAVVREEFDGRPFSESDAPWLGRDALILRATAVTELRDLLDANGELLPLECADARLWIYNPMLIEEALDFDASEIVRFSDGGIMEITRHVFNPAAIGPRDIFKIPMRGSMTYVSEQFVERWQRAGLRGLEFIPADAAAALF